MQSIKKKPIILFDGICNLCSSSVKFILRHDKREQFLFSSLQSDASKKLLLQYNVKKIAMDSIVLIQDGVVYQKSTAAIKISQELNWPWNMFSIAKHLPLVFRDKLYDLVANHRYKWFGKKDTCLMMMPTYKNRFI